MEEHHHYESCPNASSLVQIMNNILCGEVLCGTCVSRKIHEFVINFFIKLGGSYVKISHGKTSMSQIWACANHENDPLALISNDESTFIYHEHHQIQR
jgi:hypothetical protein